MIYIDFSCEVKGVIFSLWSPYKQPHAELDGVDIQQVYNTSSQMSPSLLSHSPSQSLSLFSTDLNENVLIFCFNEWKCVLCVFLFPVCLLFNWHQQNSLCFLISFSSSNKQEWETSVIKTTTQIPSSIFHTYCYALQVVLTHYKL